MEVIWKMPENKSPVLYRKRLQRTGFEIFHWRILAGQLTEETRTVHEINIAVSGTVVTHHHTPTGKTSKNEHQPGSICLIPAGHSAQAVWETEIECLRIALDPDYMRQAAIEQNLAGRFELIEAYSRHDPVTQYLALALLNEAKAAEESLGLMYAESLAQTLILHLLKHYSTAGGKSGENLSGGLSGKRLRRAQEYITEHLEEDLTLRQISAAVGFSQFHFAREFRRSTGLTPQRYLMQLRIGRAKELLANGDLPIVEVGLRAGFKNQSHFTTLFRKSTALTPKVFRQIKQR